MKAITTESVAYLRGKLAVGINNRDLVCIEQESTLLADGAHATAVRVLELTDEVNRLRTALARVGHEVTSKKGGPERDDCVSVPYLFGLVTAALAGKPQAEWPH